MEEASAMGRERLTHQEKGPGRVVEVGLPGSEVGKTWQEVPQQSAKPGRRARTSSEGWAKVAFAISPRLERKTHTKVRFPSTDNPCVRHWARHQGCKEQVTAETASCNWTWVTGGKVRVKEKVWLKRKRRGLP